MTPRAGFVSRLAAFAVDLAIELVTLHSTVWILEGATRNLRKFAPRIDLGSLLLGIAPLLVAIYTISFWTVLGQTPGKWLLGVKIVAKGGAPIGFRRSLVRFVGYVLSALPAYLGFLWILGPQRRGWHDRLAGTEVVYVAPRRRPAERERITARPSLRRLPARAT